MTTGPARTRFNWWPVEFSIGTNEEHVKRWIQHHFHTTEVVAAIPTASVALDANADLVLAAQLTAEIAERDGSVETYAGHSWDRGRHGGRRAWSHGPSDSYHTQLVLIENGPSSWSLTAGSSRDAAIAAIRIIREILRTQLAVMRAHTFHASMAMHSQFGGVLVLGPQGTGKTTLALALGQEGRFISGDQVELLFNGRGDPIAVGFPWPVRIRRGTARWLDLDPAGPNLRAGAPGRSVAAVADEVTELTMLECSTVLDVRTQSFSQVNAVLFVRPSGDGAPVLQELDRKSIAKCLKEDSREPDPAFPEFWLEERANPHPPALSVTEVVARLVNVPTAMLTWSPVEHSTYDAVSLVKSWMAR